MLFSGERIKVFSETDIRMYEKWIESQGFSYKFDGDYLVVLGKDNPQYDKGLFSKVLNHRMKLRGISKEELAEKIGVTEYTIFTWRIGRFMPKADNLENIMKVLKISQEELEKCRI